ncbi:MAG: cobalamin-independent methionine synthase II family protein [Gammaproteobacteria bacterium]|nr:cobalamin-independent methionine synthase II family protein [Gammaproteobacteria bacterium]
MKLSTDRILTTHVGSLPRPDGLAELLLAREAGEAVDAAVFDTAARAAVHDIVRRQAGIGIDVVSDGEMSKMSYSTYIKDRCSGFAGDSPRRPPADLARFPAFMERQSKTNEAPPIKRPVCTGPIAVRNRAPLATDIANFTSALEAVEVSEAFMNASSPGVISAFLPNEFYADEQHYLEALGAAMQEEYEAIVGAGFILQIDCPDLAMARHTQYKDLSDDDFVRQAEKQAEVLNAALVNVPAERCRMHICWGNYEGPHDFDIALAKVVHILLRAKPQGLLFEAANARHAHEWAVWRELDIPADKVLIPGVIDTCSNYIEHPDLVAERLCRFADIVGRERVLAGTDCGFSTFARYGHVVADIAFEKLRALVAGAEVASRRLWAG